MNAATWAASRYCRNTCPRKLAEIEAWNAGRPGDIVNHRRLTNIGTFRTYIENYLRHHPGIHQEMTMMVRQLAPTADGAPLELVLFHQHGGLGTLRRHTVGYLRSPAGDPAGVRLARLPASQRCRHARHADRAGRNCARRALAMHRPDPCCHTAVAALGYSAALFIRLQETPTWPCS